MNLSVIGVTKRRAAKAAQYRAYLNGKEVAHAFKADARLGKVWRYKVSPEGNLTIKDGVIETEVLRGHVRIKKPKPRGIAKTVEAAGAIRP